MRSTNATLFTGIIVIAVGILLIAFNSRGELLNWVVILAGLSIALPCAYALISTLSSMGRARREGANTISVRFANSGMIVASVIGIVLGLWIICDSNFFIRFLTYAFAFLLIIYGLYHIVVVSVVCRPMSMPVLFYIFPIMMVIAGFVIFFSSLHTLKSTVVIITGIGLIGAGINSIMEYTSMRRAKRTILEAVERSRQQQPTPTPTQTDAARKD